MYTPEQRRLMLALARNAIIQAVKEKRLEIPTVEDAALHEMRGAFVTLTKTGRLRGCIGYPEAMYPLYETITRGGVSAALRDPRFPPVSPTELDDLHIEISVLSPLEDIHPEQVEVGTHGLVIEHGYARGLLLPQVPVEWGWDRDQFLAQTCVKAGLPPDAWQTGGKLFAFTAEVFSEEDLVREESPALG